MPTTYREGKLAGLNRSISDVGEFAIQKQLLDQQRKKELQDAVKKAVITSVLSGKGRFKTPVNVQDIIDRGEMPDLNQFVPINTPTTSISITERPYAERLKAREIAARTPEDWYSSGMATGLGKPIESKNRMRGTGLFGSGWGPGSQFEPEYLTNEKGEPIKNFPKFGQYSVSPEAVEAQAEAAGIAKNPYRISRRLGSTGNIDIGETGAEAQSELSAEDEQTVAEAMADNPDKSREEIIQALIEQGYL